jgi:hypothetical protein
MYCVVIVEILGELILFEKILMTTTRGWSGGFEKKKKKKKTNL